MQSNTTPHSESSNTVTTENAVKLVCASCAKKIESSDVRFCRHCGTRVSEEFYVTYIKSGRNYGLVKIEGWLHVVSIFVFTQVLTSIFSMFANLNDPFETAMGLESLKYMRLITMLFIFYVAYLFLNRKKSFPKYYIACKVFGFSVGIYMLSLANIEASLIPEEMIGIALLATVPDICVCWYLLVSKRVKLTFTQG